MRAELMTDGRLVVILHLKHSIEIRSFESVTLSKMANVVEQFVVRLCSSLLSISFDTIGHVSNSVSDALFNSV